MWGAFNGTDHDLRLSKKVDFTDGIAASTLRLEYVDEFYDEYKGNGNTDAVVDYFFNVHCKGAEKKKSELLRMPMNQMENRRIVFEEAVQTIEAVGVQTWWKPGPAKERWIYVFGNSDGSSFKSVWEIKTDSSGKFATFKLTEENYDNRPTEEKYKDVALLPRKDLNGTEYFYFACLSEIRLEKERIFGKEGLLSDPLKRCLDIDDEESVPRQTDTKGNEHVILMNYLKEAERLREQFDKIFPDWMNLRLPSSAEIVESKKKEKLIYEYGALIMQIVSAYPDYKKQFDPAKLKSLENSVIETDARKASLTGEVIGKANILCDWIDTEKFVETCRDYLFLIQESSSQSTEFETFEKRIGALFVDLTRFSRGIEVLRKLLPEVKAGEQQTWLQDLLLLKNDSWNATGEQLFGEQKGSPNGVKIFKNARKIGKRVIDLLKEAAVSGAGVYSPQNMGKIIQKVLRTCAESVLLDVAPVSMKSVSGVRPFSQVMFSKSTASFKKFWDFKFPKGEKPGTLPGKVLTSAAIDDIMNMLEGVSVAFGVWDVMNREYKSGIDATKTVKDLLSLAEFIWKVVLKKGKGPAYVIGVFTNGIDAYVSLNDAVKAQGNYDYDSAFWNYVACGSFALSAIAGAGALAATFFAGAASVSLTGIGIAPGVLLFAVGTIIAVTAKSASDMTKNTAIENLLVISPWGKHPEFSIDGCESESLKKHFIKAITILNMFKVEIDVDHTVIKLLLRQLNSETIVTLKTIEFGNSSTGKNVQKIVGTDVRITEDNCTVSELADGRHCLTVDLGQVCKTRYDMYWLANKPSFVKVCATVDLKGDNTILLPDTKKSVCAQRYGIGESNITIQ
ncbi:MAG TPA: hypothetical protein VHO70_07975 [Chitinispirillaceae bacterium]|nr:hypothetical protein [Chitinispirillaceae bacterium]